MISVPTVQSCELTSVPTAYNNELVEVPRVYGNGGFLPIVYGSEWVWNHTYYTFYLNTVSHIPFTSVNFLTIHPDSSVLRCNVTYFIFHFCHVTFYQLTIFHEGVPFVCLLNFFPPLNAFSCDSYRYLPVLFFWLLIMLQGLIISFHYHT